MGIMGRIANILKADVNGFLDEHESVERSLDQAVRNSTDDLMKAHDTLIEATAAYKGLEHSVESTEALVNKWQETAELAVAAGDDDLLHRSLTRKNIAQEALDAGQKTLKQQRAALDDLETEFEEAKVENETIMQEREELVARHKIMQVQSLIVKSKATSHNAVTGFHSVFDRIRQQVEKQEYRSQAAIEHSHKHSSLRAPGFNSRVGAEAAAMKAAWRLAEQQVQQAQQDDADTADIAGKTDDPGEEDASTGDSMVVSKQPEELPKV